MNKEEAHLDASSETSSSAIGYILKIRSFALSTQTSPNQNGQAATIASPNAQATTPKAPAISAEELQLLIDQAATINVLSVPNQEVSGGAIRSAGGIIGFNINEIWHRFSIDTLPATNNQPMRASNTVGERIGKASQRWLLTPDNYPALPAITPPPTLLDLSRPQRFVMLDGLVSFGDGSDGFRGFGTGVTAPAVINGRPQLQVSAVATVLEGFGKFKGHAEGTYLYCGTLDPEGGFSGNVLLRIMDLQNTLITHNTLIPMIDQPNPEEGITYMLFRGEAVASDPVGPNIGPNGQPIGVVVEQGLRLLHVDTATRGPQGLQSNTRVGEIIGRITTRVVFNPASASGTLLDPIPFTNVNELVFTDQQGNTVGSFTADSSEGRVFNLEIGGAACIRFGGTGAIYAGKGPFEGINGIMTDNSVVAFDPHVSASVYVLRINDPGGKFRARITQPATTISPDYPFPPNYVEVLGSKMHYVDVGKGDPILLLHGNPTWSYLWRNIIPHLTPLGRVIAPDLIGYGLSDKPGIGYNWADYIPYVDGFIEKLGLKNITLVLHDQGSSFGFNYASRNERNIKALAFFEAIIRPFPWDQFSTPEFRDLFKAFRTGDIGGQGWQMIVTQNMFIDALLPQAAGRPLSQKELDYYRLPFQDPLNRMPIWQFPRNTSIGGEPKLVTEAVTAYSNWLQKTCLPKLLLYASPGALITAENLAWARENIQGLQTVDLGEGSHFLQESSPHEIGRAIAEFITNL